MVLEKKSAELLGINISGGNKYSINFVSINRIWKNFLVYKTKN